MDKNEKQEENQEEVKERKPIYHYVETIEVTRFLLEADKRNEDNLQRIRLETNVGDVTLRLDKSKTEIKERNGLEIMQKKQDLYTIEDFEKQFPTLLKLALEVKKSKSETIVLTYVETFMYNDVEKEWNAYKYMKPQHAYSVHYEKVHKDDGMIKKQEEMKNKYTQKEV